MPWNGSGVFARIYSWAADRDAGLDILADRMDTDTNDIAQGLMHCLTINGETVPTANLPLNNFRFTGASSGVANSDFVTLGQLKNGGGGLSGGFLPLSGGTLTGALIVQDNANPNITLNNTAAGPIFGMWAGGGRLNFGISNASGVPQTNLANFDGSGNLFTAGTLTGTTVTASANRLIASGGSSPSVTLVNTVGGGPFCMYNAASNLQWGTANSAGAPTASLMRLDGSGNLTVGGGFWGGSVNLGGGGITAGNVNLSGGINAPGGVNAGGGTITAGAINASGNLTVSGSIQGGYVVSTGDVHANSNLTCGNSLIVNGLTLQNSSGYLYTPQAFWANGGIQCRGNGINYGLSNNSVAFNWSGSGAGLWIDNVFNGYIQTTGSTRAWKRDIQPSSVDALAQVRCWPLFEFERLQPNDLDAPGRHCELGFVAEDLAEVTPDAVIPAGENTGAGLDLLPLCAYLARAVQQLDERLERLAGARG